MFVEFKDGQQNTFPIWEDIVLIFASTPDEAMQKANALGISREGDSQGTLTWESRPARWVFAGVRKLIHCNDTPGDGVEITYSEFTVNSKAELDLLATGEAVNVLYEM